MHVCYVSGTGLQPLSLSVSPGTGLKKQVVVILKVIYIVVLGGKYFIE